MWKSLRRLLEFVQSLCLSSYHIYTMYCILYCWMEVLLFLLRILILWCSSGKFSFVASAIVWELYRLKIRSWICLSFTFMAYSFSSGFQRMKVMTTVNSMGRRSNLILRLFSVPNEFVIVFPSPMHAMPLFFSYSKCIFFEVVPQKLKNFRHVTLDLCKCYQKVFGKRMSGEMHSFKTMVLNVNTVSVHELVLWIPFVHFSYSFDYHLHSNKHKKKLTYSA